VAAIKQPWRMAAGYLGDDTSGLAVFRRNEARWRAVQSMARSGTNSPLTSSAGRLFDAVASLLGLRDTINYEGQAAIELEQVAEVGERGGYRAKIAESDRLVVCGADLVRSCADDLRAGVTVAVIAARFHHGVVDAITRSCAILAERTGLRAVALSGGVFQNLLLLDGVVSALERMGFRVLTHSRVPTNDGGISLGQAVVAGRIGGRPVV
jgi:hydrogenase maturation protein HypF